MMNEKDEGVSDQAAEQELLRMEEMVGAANQVPRISKVQSRNTKQMPGI